MPQKNTLFLRRKCLETRNKIIHCGCQKTFWKLDFRWAAIDSWFSVIFLVQSQLVPFFLKPRLKIFLLSEIFERNNIFRKYEVSGTRIRWLAKQPRIHMYKTRSFLLLLFAFLLLQETNILLKKVFFFFRRESISFFWEFVSEKIKKVKAYLEIDQTFLLLFN